MAFLLVPREVSPTTASVWVGALNETFDPTAVVVTSSMGPQAVGSNWQGWPAEAPAPVLRYQSVVLSGLAPGKSYPLELRVNGDPRARATATTLPDRLPAPPVKPFTILLGSCFFWQQDEGGRVGNTFFRIPAGARPHLKILCGDQVYLDAPWLHYLLHTHTPSELAARFLACYQRTWTQSGVGSGFRRVLEGGANYFTADDHEFWNNAPGRASVVRDTWFEQGRHDWFAVAKSLYGAFQTEAQIATFSVGPLGFLVADTRTDRRADETSFMKDQGLERIRQWVDSLVGPGVLVLGQPVFDAPTGFIGHFTDWGLPDYRQYRTLVRILAAAQHSLVVLTGDVHFGRVASCTLRPGVELVEVISSPMALVDEAARGKWAEAPQQFPAFEIPGVVPSAVRTEGKASSDNHFMTLEFSQVGAAIEMVVKYWPVVGAGDSPRVAEWYRTRLR